MPNDATLDGAGHTITAVEDADPPELPRPGPGLRGRNNSAPAKLDVKNLDITTQGFEGGSNSGGLLNGIYMYRAGGSLTNVSVNGISHGNGVQEGNAISIRNRVAGDDINVPRAQVALTDIDVTNYQKTGLLLDGNLTFSVKNAHVGQGAGPQGQPNPIIAANSLQISRGASGSVTDSTFKLNSHAQATAALLYNAKKVDFDRSHHRRRRAGDHGHQRLQRLQHDRDHLHDAGRCRHGYGDRGRQRRRVASAGPRHAMSATLTDTTVTGWEHGHRGEVTTTPPHDPDHPRGDEGRRDRQVPREPSAAPAACASPCRRSSSARTRPRAACSVGRSRSTATGPRRSASTPATPTSGRRRSARAPARTPCEILKNGVSQRTYKVRTR